jgi:hypothetical protein
LTFDLYVSRISATSNRLFTFVFSIIVWINYGAQAGLGRNLRKEERNKWGSWKR